MIVPFLVVGAMAPKPTSVTFVRHGETQANATGKYNSATLNSFSALGQSQVDALTKRLIAGPRYSMIVVSPSPRALKTIAPYLRATRQKAIVWPLLYECCTGHRKKGTIPAQLKYGARIKLPSDIASLFILEPGHDRLPVAPDYLMGLRQVEDSVREFRERFAGQNLLVVGHSGHGGQFIHALTGKWKKVENATEIRFQVP